MNATREALLARAVLLFVLGSSLVLGAFFLFNKYSLSNSHHFSAYHQTWEFPSPPLELNEGDKVTVVVTKSGGGGGPLYITNTAGQQTKLGELGNSTVYYYIQTSDLYHFHVRIDSFSNPPGFVDTTVNVEVVAKNPNLMFQFMGCIVLLAGAVTIPVAFLCNKKTN